MPLISLGACKVLWGLGRRTRAALIIGMPPSPLSWAGTGIGVRRTSRIPAGIDLEIAWKGGRDLEILGLFDPYPSAPNHPPGAES
jgi:hypothetical protein